MKTDTSIDTLRGFACLLLVFYHVIGADPTVGMHVEGGALRILNDGLAYLRMPLFTFLSGLVYAYRPYGGDDRGFLLGKTRRLLVPMLVVGTLFALVQSNAPGVNFVSRDWHLLHIEPVAHFWFLESLFWVFVVIWLLERRRALDTPRAFALVWLLAALLYLTVRGPRLLGIEGAIYLLPYFLGGLAVTRFSLRSNAGGALTRTLLIAAAMLAVVMLDTPVPNPDRRTFWILVAGMSLCALCVGLRIEQPWLARVGASSYPIYLFHVFFTAAARIILQQSGLAMFALQIVAGVILGVVGPMLVERWSARNGVLRVLLLGKSSAHARRAIGQPRPQG